MVFLAAGFLNESVGWKVVTLILGRLSPDLMRLRVPNTGVVCRCYRGSYGHPNRMSSPVCFGFVRLNVSQFIYTGGLMGKKDLKVWRLTRKSQV